jgi:hypothetical protein
MERSTIYFSVAFVAIILIGRVLFLNRKDRNKTPISPLRGLAFVVILVSLFFGQSSLLVYPVMGFGLLLILADEVKQRQKIKTS